MKIGQLTKAIENRKNNTEKARKEIEKIFDYITGLGIKKSYKDFTDIRFEASKSCESGGVTSLNHYTTIVAVVRGECGLYIKDTESEYANLCEWEQINIDSYYWDYLCIPDIIKALNNLIDGVIADSEDDNVMQSYETLKQVTDLLGN